MKIRWLIIFLCLFKPTAGFSQYLQGFQIGIKAGGTFSNFLSSTDYRSKGQPGYQAGVYTRIGGAGFNFQPEFYVQKTSLSIDDPGEDGGLNKSNFTTLNAPLMAGYKIGTDSFGARLCTGPVIILRLQNDQQFIGGQRLNFQDENYGWIVGGGLDFHNLSVDIRYEAGLNKIGYGYVSNQSTKMNLISLSLSFNFFSAYSLY